MFKKDLRQRLDRELKHYSEQINIPGMALVVSKDGKIFYEYYFGYRDVERKLPVTGETIFGLASITKSFAALAIMQLEEKNYLQVTDPVKRWIPEFALPNNQPADEVKIHHLLTHTAGLPGLPVVHQARLGSILKDPDGQKLFANNQILTLKQITRPEQLVEEIKRVDTEVLGRPGESFNYSNEGYALLQQIIERASGMDFITYMNEKILGPLQMKRSSFIMEELKKYTNITELYAYHGEREKGYFPSPTWWDVGEIYTNGSLKASAYDLINYANMYVQEGIFENKKILSPNQIRKMSRPHVTTVNNINYGYGLIIEDVYGEKVFGHGGGIKGVSSHFLISPKKKLAIVVLMNIAEAPAENMAHLALRSLLNKEEEELRFKAKPTLPNQAEKYLGSYASLEGQRLEVELGKESELVLHVGKNALVITPIGNHRFVTNDGKIVAFIERNGEIVGIFRGLRYLDKVK